MIILIFSPSKKNKLKLAEKCMIREDHTLKALRVYYEEHLSTLIRVNLNFQKQKAEELTL